MKARHLLTAMVLASAIAGAVKGDFVLRGTQHLDVYSYHQAGELWDFSTADVRQAGHIVNAWVNDSAQLDVGRGSVHSLYAYDTSSVLVSDGRGYVDDLWAYNSSSMTVSGGSLAHLYAYDTSSVVVSEGSVGNLYAHGTSSVRVLAGNGGDLWAEGASRVDISGGNFTGVGGGNDFRLYARDTSAVTIYGYDFRTADGLVLDGNVVLGVGTLTGRWFDGTAWTIPVTVHDPGATILAVPEPATLSLLAVGLGALSVRRRKRN